MAGKGPQLPKDYVIKGVEVLDSQTLGEGSYGVVYLGKYCGLLCAVKKLKPSMFPSGLKQLDQTSELVLQSFYNECEKLCKVRHPNIVQLLGLYSDKDSNLPVIVMELMHESLSRLLYRTKSLPLYVEVNICHDVVQALAYLHALRPPIVHRDLSSNNILLSLEYRAKITDLGVAKVDKGSFLNWDNTPAPGTFVYMPPEVRKVPADLSPAMDIFSVGVNILQTLTHKFPHPGPELAQSVLGFSKIVPERERRKEHLEMVSRSHPLRPLVLDCLKDSPRDRPSALRLCERLEAVKEKSNYVESLKVANVQLDQMDVAMQRIASLEHKLEDLTQQLADKTSHLERVMGELDRERAYTADLLNQRAREQIELDLQQQHTYNLPDSSSAACGQSVETTPPELAFPIKTDKKKKKKLIFNLRKFRQPKPPPIPEEVTQPPREVTTEDGDTATNESSSAPEDNPHVSDSDIGPYDSLDEDIGAIDSAQQHYKELRLKWFSHDCLPVGLQGSTLKVHHCDGRLYLCGGAKKDGSPNTTVYCCSVRNMTHWEQLSPEAPQYHCASVIVHNELVLVGGHVGSDSRVTGALNCYDHKAGLWVPRLPAMPTPRASATAFMAGDYLVVNGGQKGDGEVINTMEVLHILSMKWEAAARLPENLAGQSVALCGDEVFLVGGLDGAGARMSVYVAPIPKIISSCHFFSLFTSTDRAGRIWRQLANCPFTLMTAVCFGEQLFIIGGQEVTKTTEEPAGLIWLYSRQDNTWSPVQRLPSARQLCCATVLPDNRLVVIGGDPVFTTVNIAEMH